MNTWAHIDRFEHGPTPGGDDNICENIKAVCWDGEYDWETMTSKEKICKETCADSCLNVFGGIWDEERGYCNNQEQENCNFWVEKGGYCDTWCQPAGGWFDENGICSFAGPGESSEGLSSCMFVHSFCYSNMDESGTEQEQCQPYCDSYCMINNGRYEPLEGKDGEMSASGAEQCVWDNVSQD